MGCWYSRIDREEIVSRSKARKRYMKQLVKARQALASSHSMYLRSLRGTGSALLQFSNNETTTPRLYNHHNHTPPPPMSPGSDTWTSSTIASVVLRPPPPPPPQSSNWDFWDPFVPATESRLATEDEWEAATSVSEAVVTATTPTIRAVSMAAPPSAVTGFTKDTESELAMVVSRNSKELVEIVKEVDEYFLKAADAGSQLSLLLEVSSPNFPAQSKGHNYGTVLSRSHSSTIERLYAWEKKLYQEVKNAETIKMEHEKRVVRLRKLELKRAEYVKTEKTKKEIEKLESQMMVASQAIKTISTEIIQLRESELYPQLLDLVKGLMCMWRSMYEIHQVHTHIVQQLKYLKFIPSNEPTAEVHRQSTLQLEFEVQQWHSSFCNLVKAQRDYIQSLAGWLRLIDRIPDKVASEGIKSFLTVIHTIVIQQAQKHKQKKKADSTSKEFEKKVAKLRSLESKHGSFSMPEMSKYPVTEKRTKVEMLRAKAAEEKNKHEKLVSVTRAMTLNNLQMGFPHVFQAMVGFSSVCMQAFESVYNQAKAIGEDHDVKRILP
ncbi:putative L-ascorbate peroxidase 3-like [Hibiscus syriacus]|uniref:L-ascorbate peroxidase 3-like n=1 Tax=Hibiscus syriacus TaxID=106335 RepID=A0A6A3CEU9_HIBSY|nr:putative L-ascorbate peroxidase 3-like [Hibiscus syriacus]